MISRNGAYSGATELPLKRDADAILTFMQGLATTLRLDDNRKWWPGWLFRSDHVENAAAILNSGELLSRELAEKRELIIKDSASQQHVDQLVQSQRRYVRLYFRPRTPTQYRNEGIRPEGEIWKGAHMPVPVYLLFRSRLMTESSVKFSRGRLTRKSQLGQTAKFLASMDFKAIYHDQSVGKLGTPGRDKILLARHAEALVQDRLPLDHLKHIVCRSAPERDTLLNLLNPEERNQWIKKIRVDDSYRRLFHRNLGTFVKETHLTEQGSQFTFQPCASDLRGPFRLRIEWSGKFPGYVHEVENFVVPNAPFKLSFPDGKTLPEYDVRVRLNDDTAYIGNLRSKDPFVNPF